MIFKQKITGFILIVVLALLSVLAFLSITFVQVSKNTRESSRFYIDKTRSNVLAQSGFEYMSLKVKGQYLSYDQSIDVLYVGEGTYRDNGDIIQAHFQDLNGKININDGLAAGQLEVNQDPSFTKYYPDALDPYPNENIYDPIHLDDPLRQEEFNQARSAFLNLRLRRILNAYGDVHRYIDKSYGGDYQLLSDQDYVNSITPPEPHFSINEYSSSDSDRGFSMSGTLNLSGANDWINYNNGLGDRIIEARPINGYQSIKEIETVVNQWATVPGISLSRKYLGGHNFFDKVSQDLTVVSFEDDRFFRLDDETRFGYFHASVTADHGDFAPRDLQLEPPDFTNMWLKHSVPLININLCSFFVRAAVFYAPTNVSYFVESATTIPPYTGDPLYSDLFDSEMAVQSMIASPSIGVAPPTFSENLETLEHGQNIGRKNHLMSLKDAMWLSHLYEDFISPKTFFTYMTKNTFDDFSRYVLDESYYYEISGDEEGMPVIEYFSHFERVDCHMDTPYYDSGTYYNGGHHFYVSEYDYKGEFLSDYISYGLPHILGCVRRIPSYLGAPMSLQSPYLIVKPDKDRHEYKQGELNKQGFYKVEDFVWRFIHPKICFIPTGFNSIVAKGKILDANHQILSQSKVSANIKSFETSVYRTQKDFQDITYYNNADEKDPKATHMYIKFGPEFSGKGPEFLGQEPSRYLGFVGLDDFDGDYDPTYGEQDRDDFMTLGEPDHLGYKPQIIMNFNPNGQENGFRNLANRLPWELSINREDSNNDLWVEAVNDSDPSESFAQALVSSHMEGSEMSIFGDGRQHNGMSDFNPFNGLHFSSINHGEFANADDDVHFGFNNSLYFRLDPWLDQFSTDPIGKSLSSGIMTFWFQLPSGYYFPTKVFSSIDGAGEEIDPVSFSHVLVSLNLWEAYEASDDPIVVERPISLVVGLKNIDEDGLRIFARYDSGGESYLRSHASYQFIAPNEFGSLTGFNRIALFDGSSAEYDSFNFWCDSGHQDSPYNYEEFPNLNYQQYRRPTHRSSEVSVLFRNNRKTAPGTWHRASIFWNFHWDDDLIDIGSYDQLYLELHSTASKSGSTDVYQNQFYDNVARAPFGYMPGELFSYPLSDPEPPQSGVETPVNQGFMHPFDSTMVLSLGEAHGRRFGDYKIDGAKASRDKHYYPFWRLNSTIDNFRLWMGPSDPAQRNIPDLYFDWKTLAQASRVGRNGLGQNEVGSFWTGMRYYVISDGTPYMERSNIPGHPRWVVAPPIEKDSQLLNISSRIFNPPNLSNYPNVLIEASNDRQHFGDQEAVFQVNDLSQNEQELFFPKTLIDENFKISFQYQGHRPKHDRNLKSTDLDSIGYWYTDTSPSGHKDDMTAIPWIKELTIRSIPPGGEKILSLDRE